MNSMAAGMVSMIRHRHCDGECCVVLSLSSRRYEYIPTLAFYFPENTLGGERIEIS